MSDAPYELVEHTADLALRVRGQDLGEVCRRLTWAVCDLLADARTVRPSRAISVSLAAPDREALLVALANELIYRRDADGLLLPELELERLADDALVGVLRGEPAEPRHGLRPGLKAATWHGLEVREISDGVELFLVFDV